MHRGGCLELYYCNMVEWFWCDSSLISTTNWFLQCFDTVGLVIWPVTIVPQMTNYVLSGTLNPIHSPPRLFPTAFSPNSPSGSWRRTARVRRREPDGELRENDVGFLTVAFDITWGIGSGSCLCYNASCYRRYNIRSAFLNDDPVCYHYTLLFRTFVFYHRPQSRMSVHAHLQSSKAAST